MPNAESARIFARQTERYAKLKKIENQDVKLLKQGFPYFIKKIIDKKSFDKLLEIVSFANPNIVASECTTYLVSPYKKVYFIFQSKEKVKGLLECKIFIRII